MIVSPTSTGSGSASWVWPVRITSIPVTRAAIFLSTSKPLWHRQTTSSAPSARTSSTISCIRSSRMPKLYSGNIQPGLAIGI